MQDQIIKQITNLIERSQKILVMPSSPPDGDSIGSALAMYEVLKKLDKEVTVVCADTVPDVLRFLPHNEIIRDKFNPSQDFIVTLDCSKNEIDNIRYNVEKEKVNLIITPKEGTFSPKDVSFHYGPAKFDLIITVDTATLDQLGVLYQGNVEFFYNTPIINIDHHASNEYFGTINLVDVTAASATEILLRVFQSMEKGEALVDDDIATLLLAGIITDTGSFQNANTTPKSFAVASSLLKMGARQQEIIKNVYKTKELSTLKLWGTVLSKLHYDRKTKIVWSTLSQQDFIETGSKPEETGGIIDELMSNAPGAEIILLIKEKENNLISCSMRTTTPSVNASELAGHFGGGGHPQASGFRLRGKTLAEAEIEILNFLKSEQAKRLDLEKESDHIEINQEYSGALAAHNAIQDALELDDEEESAYDYWTSEDDEVESDSDTEEKSETKNEERPSNDIKNEDNLSSPENEQSTNSENKNPLEELIDKKEKRAEDSSDNDLNKLFYKFRDQS